MWAVMKLYKWSSLSLTGPVKGKISDRLDNDNQPSRFIPVFETRQQAIDFENGDERYIAELSTLQDKNLDTDR